MSWCSRNVGSSIVSDLSLLRVNPSLPRVNPFALEHVCYMGLCVFRFLTLSLFYIVFSCVACFSFRLPPGHNTPYSLVPPLWPLVMFSSFMVQTAEAQKRYRRERGPCNLSRG